MMAGRTMTGRRGAARLWVAAAAMSALPLLDAAAWGGDPSGTVLFADGFEAAMSVEDLLAGPAGGWTFQITGANAVTLDRSDTRSGAVSLRFDAGPSGTQVSKALIDRDGLALFEGETVTIGAWMRIPSGQDLDNVFLMDLECRACWPLLAARSNPSPGIRLVLKGTDGEPAVEREKIGIAGGSLRAPAAVPVPRDRWVHVAWTIRLSPRDDGEVAVSFDGRTVLRRRGATMPAPDAFVDDGVVLNTPVSYDRVQLGITANASKDATVLFLDDVRIERE